MTSQPPTPRVCANCSCTETPLWRRSPLGPKTLCNACGVRMKKGRLVFVPHTARFITVESPAAAAKRQRKEREREARLSQHANPSDQPSVADHAHLAHLHHPSPAVQVSPTSGIGKSTSTSSRRKGKSFKGATGLYYLLAAIEFIETS